MQSFLLLAALIGAVVSGHVIPHYSKDNEAAAKICGSTGSTTHIVVKGDTLTTIAKQYSSGICDIATVNKIFNPNFILAGQSLQVPVNCTTPDDTSCVPPPPPDPTWTCVPGPPSTYDVRSGDNLSNIAKSFNITLDAIVAANPQIENIDLIFPAQVIHIPVCPDSQCDVQTYSIRSGDVFIDLAKASGTTTGQILAFNVGVDAEALEVGQQIILPSSCHNFTTAVL